MSWLSAISLKRWMMRSSICFSRKWSEPIQYIRDFFRQKQKCSDSHYPASCRRNHYPASCRQHPFILKGNEELQYSGIPLLEKGCPKGGIVAPEFPFLQKGKSNIGVVSLSGIYELHSESRIKTSLSMKHMISI